MVVKFLNDKFKVDNFNVLEEKRKDLEVEEEEEEVIRINVTVLSLYTNIYTI